MPLLRKLEPDLWEIRSHVSDGIARILVTIEADRIVLLHGFIKKSAKIPQDDLSVARRRLVQLRGMG